MGDTEIGGTYLEVALESGVTRFPLAPGSLCRIGRDRHSTIVLNDHQVSRHHALIHGSSTGEYILTDLGSRNGTALNQRPIGAAVALQNGDRIRVGAHEFVFTTVVPARDTAEAMPSETAIRIEQQLVTVLVSDIRDFTVLSQRLGEARLSQVLSRFMQDAGAMLQREGASIQKYIGDAVMAVWIHEHRVPVPRQLFGVFSALDLLFRIVDGLQGRFDLDTPIRIGAGINTGLACLGNMGSEAAADYTALSEDVNLAFRLESVTKTSGWDVAIGHKTFEALQHPRFETQGFERHMVVLKGYSQAQAVYGGLRSAIRPLADSLQSALLADSAATQENLRGRSTDTGVRRQDGIGGYPG